MDRVRQGIAKAAAYIRAHPPLLRALAVGLAIALVSRVPILEPYRELIEAAILSIFLGADFYKAQAQLRSGNQADE